MSVTLEPAERLVRSHAFTAPVEWRDSGNGTDFTLRGYAAKFNQPSDDLGGFREILAPGAFRSSLNAGPDVRLLFNHDPNFVMARTTSGTLELREDDTGLYVWARVAPTAWVADLRTSMQRGDIDQMSFAFTINEGGDDWALNDEGSVIRTINPDGVRGLYDVSVVTYPAYPQTEASMRSVLEEAAVLGRIPGWATPETIAPVETDPVVDSRTASRLAAFRLRRERVANAHPLLETE